LAGRQSAGFPFGFTVSKYANGLQNPRWIYVAPNGYILLAEANTEPKGVKKAVAEISGKANSRNTSKSANRITLFGAADGDGKPERREEFLAGLHQRIGMLMLKNHFYVANTDGLWRYPYQKGQTRITGRREKILDLEVYGRPVGVEVLPDDSMVVADDASNPLWQVIARP
jgi:glucose/arabinose dehydrogenase